MKLILLLLWLALPVWAHDGEDHSHAPEAAMPSTGAAPRASARTPDVELVAVLEGGKLMLYLDRFASNEPLAGAVVDVESGTFKATAAPVAPGVYAVEAEGLNKPGKHALTLSVQAGDLGDLLTATLEIAPPAASPSASAARWPRVGVWEAGAAVLLLVVAVLATALRGAWRRRSGRHGLGERFPQ